MRGAPADQVSTEPFLLNFLADLAVRRGDFTEAVRLREQAVAASGDRDTAYRLTLAATIRRRMLSEPGGSGADLRRALGHAQAAVEERRRWSGPSADALAEVLDILTTAGDMTAVVTAALPASEAGSALDAEAAAPGVARRGAHAALASRSRPAYEFFLQLLPDGPYRRELQALDDDDQGRTAEEKIVAWIRLLDDPADDAMTARCVVALARLGVWAPQADELRGRSVLPADEYDVLKAVCRARTGESEVGIARLRELADKSLLAAGELVQLLEEDVGPGAAISEAEQQISRWQAPPLRIQYVDLLGRHGRFRDAAAFIERTIPDDSLPADVRQKLCAWYVTHQARQGRFADAAVTARAGLEIGEDTGLAWKLIMVLVNNGKLHDARKARAQVVLCRAAGECLPGRGRGRRLRRCRSARRRCAFSPGRGPPDWLCGLGVVRAGRCRWVGSGRACGRAARTVRRGGDRRVPRRGSSGPGRRGQRPGRWRRGGAGVPARARPIRGTCATRAGRRR